MRNHVLDVVEQFSLLLDKDGHVEKELVYLPGTRRSSSQGNVQGNTAQEKGAELVYSTIKIFTELVILLEGRGEYENGNGLLCIPQVCVDLRKVTAHFDAI